MSVTIKTVEMQYKGTDGQYHGINAVAEKRISDQIADIDVQLAAKEGEINSFISDAQDRIDDLVQDGDDAIDFIEENVNQLMSAIGSAAQTGTDKALISENVPADGKATGELVLVAPHDEPPTSSGNRLWICDGEEEDITIPTYEEFSDLKSAIFDKFADKDDLTVTGYINSNKGTVYSISSWIATDFININEYKKLYGTMPTLGSSNPYGMAFYNKNKEYISGVAGNVTGEASYEYVFIEVPENAVYVRLSFRVSDENNFVFYNDITAMNRSKISELSTNFEDFENSTNELLWKAFLSESNLVNSGFINSTTGSFTEISTWRATDFININEYKKLYGTMPTFGSANAAGMAFYDLNGTYISGVAGNVTGEASYEYVEISVPENAVFARFSFRGTDVNNFQYYYDKIGKIENGIETESSPTPVIFNVKNPTVPSGFGIDNKVVVDCCIDAEDITISTRVNIGNNTPVVFLGSVDIGGGSHASHVQFDFSTKEIKIYARGAGTAIPSSIIHTVNFASLGTVVDANLKIGRKNRQLWVEIEDYKTGNSVSYTVNEGTLNNYKYPAGWLADKFTYGIISGSITFVSIICTTKAEPTIAFIGDSITEGYGIPYSESWAYRVGNLVGNCLCMGRSGGNITTAMLQIRDIISKIRPKFVAVCIGTNGGNTSTNIGNMVKEIKKYGCQPILCRIPMLSSASTTATTNATITPQKVPIVGFDYATSVDNDLSTQDTSLYQTNDTYHPNANGAEALANRFMADVGELFVKGL